MSISKELRKHRIARNRIIILCLVIILLSLISHQIYGIVLGLVLLNLYTLVLMGMDKKYARNGQSFRIPEQSFYLLGALFGSLGLVLGMMIYQHKTKHVPFQLLSFLLPVHAFLLFYLFRMI
jgi:uncharacterized membrane protein YsdA (DUF1294 family)